MITDEKRAFKRVRCKFTIQYKPHGSNKSDGGTSVSENISRGGFYFTSLKEFKIGQLIDCCICMPETRAEGKWMARVVRCEKTKEKITATYGIAAEFVKAFGDSEKKLEQTLSLLRR